VGLPTLSAMLSAARDCRFRCTRISFRILVKVDAGGYVSDLLCRETAALIPATPLWPRPWYSAACGTKASSTS
jgi:hypothetical protein